MLQPVEDLALVAVQRERAAVVTGKNRCPSLVEGQNTRRIRIIPIDEPELIRVELEHPHGLADMLIGYTQLHERQVREPQNIVHPGGGSRRAGAGDHGAVGGNDLVARPAPRFEGRLLPRQLGDERGQVGTELALPLVQRHRRQIHDAGAVSLSRRAAQRLIQPDPMHERAQDLLDVGDLGVEMGRLRTNQPHVDRPLLPAGRQLRLEKLPVELGSHDFPREISGAGYRRPEAG